MQTAPLTAPIPVIPSASKIHEVIKPSAPVDLWVDPLVQPLVDIVTEPKPVQQPHLLDALRHVERLYITKRLHVKNVIFLRGKRNRFYVRTPDQNIVYTIEEENSWWVGYFCYGLRPLQLRVKNCHGVEIMRIKRPYACTSRILPCQLQYLQVYCPPGQLIGTIQQQWAAVRPIYFVKNDRGQDVFQIRGPVVTLSLFRDVQFRIQRMDGSLVGSTYKQWQGLMHALFLAPVTDRFGVSFDRELTIEEKGLLMAATLLMDYMYYDT